MRRCILAPDGSVLGSGLPQEDQESHLLGELRGVVEPSCGSRWRGDVAFCWWRTRLWGGFRAASFRMYSMGSRVFRHFRRRASAFSCGASTPCEFNVVRMPARRRSSVCARNRVRKCAREESELFVMARVRTWPSRNQVAMAASARSMLPQAACSRIRAFRVGSGICVFSAFPVSVELFFSVIWVLLCEGPRVRVFKFVLFRTCAKWKAAMSG